MKRILTVLILLTGFLQAHAGPERNVPIRSKSEGLAFMENKGQVVDNLGNQRPDILYTAHNQGVQVYFRQNALSYVFPQAVEQNGESVVTNVYRTDVEFVGANPRPEVVSEGVSGINTNFYLSNSNLNGIQARSYRKLTYRNLYDGIDLVFFASEQNGQSALKYEFVVRPGANPNVIRMRQVAAQKVNITRDGNLVVSNPLGQIEEVAPFTFQTINGAQQVVASAYEVKNGVVSFRLGQYDRNETLVIDPLTRQWATNVGGSASDRYNSVFTDANGNAYAVGQTNSINFPANVGPSKVADNSQDVVLSRFNSNGTLAWATYYGGNGSDIGSGVTQNGNAVSIVGWTGAQNLPVSPNAPQPTNAGGFDAFIAQFDATTGQFVWGTYVGGPLADQFTAIQAASNGDLYVAGRVQSSGLANVGQTTIGGSRDIWAGRFTSAGTLVWGTYYGGTNDDQATGIALGDNNDVYVTGATASNGLATAGAFQNTNNGLNDVIVVKFNSNGSRLWATYYGGAGTDVANGIAFSNGNVFVVGQTTSSAPSFSVPAGSYQTQSGGLTDAFLFALNGANGNRIMATFIGGNGTDIAFGVSTVGNNVYVAGTSNSSNFNVINPNAVNLPFQASNAGFLDKFLVKFDATAPNAARWSILNGGSSDDAIRAISSNNNGVITAVGYSNSTNLPVLNRIAQQTTTPGTGNDDATIIRFTDDAEAPNDCIVIGSINSNPILCNGGTTNVQVIALYGGAGTLTYSLVTSNGTLLSNDGMFMNVPAGAWTLTVTDGTPACTVTRTGNITQPAVLTASAQVMDVNCLTGQNGMITINAIGGTSPYQFTLGSGNSQLSNQFLNVAAGSYTVRVTDANNCMIMLPVVVGSNAPTLSVASMNPRCAGDDNGSITVEVTGGALPLQYSLNFQAPVVSNNRTNQFSNLGGGTYQVRVLDASGCSANEIVNLNAPSQLVFSQPVITLPTSCTASNGSIMVMAQGGTGAIQYSFNGGQSFSTSNTLTNLSNQSFSSIIARDANGCEARLNNINVASSDAPIIESLIRINPSCRISPNPDGQIVIIGALAGPPQPLFYSIDGGVTYQAAGPDGTGTFANLASGTYAVRVTANPISNCFASQTVTLFAPPALVVTNVSRVNPVCSNTNPIGGTLAITAQGGTGILQYSVDGGMMFQNSNLFTGLYPRPNGYSVQVRDQNGCVSFGGTYFLFNPSGLAITQTIDRAPSCGKSDGSITVFPIGGTLPRRFSINGGTETPSAATSFIFPNLAEGTYSVRVRDASGCQAEAMVTLATLNLRITTSNTVCGGTTGSINAEISGGTGPYIYTLSGTEIDGMTYKPVSVVSSAVNATNFTFGNLRAGNYTVRVQDLSGQDICVAEASAFVQSPNPDLFFTGVTKTDPTCAFGTGTVTVNATGAAHFGLVGTSNIALNSSGNFDPVPAGSYRPVIRNSTGCIVFGQLIQLTAPEPIVVASVTKVQDATCANRQLAAIQINATGGRRLVYSITAGSNVSGLPVSANPETLSQIPFGLTASTGTVTEVRVEEDDDPSCFVTFPVSPSLGFTRQSNLELSLGATTPQTCSSPNGTAIVTILGGVGPFTLLVDDAVVLGPLSTPLTNTIRNLAAGARRITVRDNSGCQATQTVVIANDVFDFTVTADGNTATPSCSEVVGRIQAIFPANPATAYPVQYSINGGGNFTTVSASGTVNRPNLPNGTYNIVARTADGCTLTKSIAVEVPGSLFTIEQLTFTNPSCPSSANGSITYRIRRNNPGVTSIQVDGPSSFTNINTTTDASGLFTRTITGLSSGTYNFIVNTSTACGNISTPPTIYRVILVDPTSVVLGSPTVINPTCGSAATMGSISIVATGGSGVFQYNLIENSTTISSNNSGQFMNLGVGSYTVSLVDLINGCATPTSGPIAVTNPTGFDITPGALTNPACNVSNGAIQVNVLGGIPARTLRLNNGTPVTVTGTSSTFSNLAAGTYSIVAQDGAGCRDNFTVSISAPSSPSVVVSPTNPTTCGTATGSLQLTVSRGDISSNEREFQVIYNGVARTVGVKANGFRNVGSGTSVVINPSNANGNNALSAGIYRVIVRNVNTPTCSSEVVVRLQDPNTPVFETPLVLNATNSNCNNGVIEARITGTGPNLVYEISSDNGFSWGGPQTSRLFQNLAAGTYYVRTRTGTFPNFCYSYSNAITVGCTTAKGEALVADVSSGLVVYPNPNNGQFTVNYSVATGRSVSLKVIDLTGKEIVSTTRDLNAGENLIDLNIANAAAGIYLLQVIDGSDIRTVKVAKN